VFKPLGHSRHNDPFRGLFWALLANQNFSHCPPSARKSIKPANETLDAFSRHSGIISRRDYLRDFASVFQKTFCLGHC
jgi:hypothetical protein